MDESISNGRRCEESCRGVCVGCDAATSRRRALGRATRNMHRFAIRRAGDRLVVDLDRLFRSDQQPQEWAAAAGSL